jgi:hypothetical protein
MKISIKKLLGFDPEVMLTFSSPVAQPGNVISKYGAPQGRVFFELAGAAPLLGENGALVYSYENLFI